MDSTERGARHCARPRGAPRPARARTPLRTFQELLLLGCTFSQVAPRLGSSSDPARPWTGLVFQSTPRPALFPVPLPSPGGTMFSVTRKDTVCTSFELGVSFPGQFLLVARAPTSPGRFPPFGAPGIYGADPPNRHMGQVDSEPAIRSDPSQEARSQGLGRRCSPGVADGVRLRLPQPHGAGAACSSPPASQALGCRGRRRERSRVFCFLGTVRGLVRPGHGGPS